MPEALRVAEGMWGSAEAAQLEAALVGSRRSWWCAESSCERRSAEEGEEEVDSASMKSTFQQH